MSVTLLHGDCRELMAGMAENMAHAIVTDPPYHLTQASRGGHARTNNPLMPHGRHRIGDKGFMGKTWDGGDVAFRPETWRHAYRVLRPGGLLLAFGGTRTYHRLVCAIEDAGFEVRDLVAWIYGNGFPKGTDKAKIPEVWAGWNTALKPAIEPICLARKPFDGTLAENLDSWGTGAMWIDRCRVPLDGEAITATGKGALPTRNDVDMPRAGAPIPRRAEDLGRWPANVIHDGSDEVLAVFPQAPGQIADASSSSSSRKNQNVYGAMKRGNGREGEPSADSDNEGAVGFKMKPGARRIDTGSAARFFYCPKASRSDRNAGLAGTPGAQNNHPTVKPTELMRYLVRLVTPPGGTVLDPFAGSGSTLKAAELEGFDAIGMELEADYVEIARRRIASDAPLFADIQSEEAAAC